MTVTTHAIVHMIQASHPARSKLFGSIGWHPQHICSTWTLCALSIACPTWSFLAGPLNFPKAGCFPGFFGPTAAAPSTLSSAAASPAYAARCITSVVLSI
jgi:hypothetical protein